MRAFIFIAFMLIGFISKAQHPAIAYYATSSMYDADAQRYIDSNATISDPKVKRALHKLALRLKRDTLWSKLAALNPLLGTTQKARSLNMKLPINNNKSRRVIIDGTFNFDSVNVGVALRGGRLYYQTLTGANFGLDTAGGVSPAEQSTIHIMCLASTTGIGSITYSRLDGTSDKNMALLYNSTQVGYNPFAGSSDYLFTANYKGVTILAGSSTYNTHVLMQNGVTLQTTYRADGSGVLFYPYGFYPNTYLNINFVGYGLGEITQAQTLKLNNIVTDFLKEIGRM